MKNTRTKVTAVVSAAALSAASILIKVSKPLESNFRMIYGDNLDIVVETEKYTDDAVILPGNAGSTYDPYIKNLGNYDAYVFLEISLPDQTFHLGDINEKWCPITSDGNTTVYAYGTSSAMTVLEKSVSSDNCVCTPHLTEKVVIDSDTDIAENTYTVEAKGYAIKQKGLNETKPLAIWETIQAELKKDTNS